MPDSAEIRQDRQNKRSAIKQNYCRVLCLCSFCVYMLACTLVYAEKHAKRLCADGGGGRRGVRG